MPKHAKVKAYEKYGPDGKLKVEKCPRCGGILANHKNRTTCGKCGYSEIKKGVENKPGPQKEQKSEQIESQEQKQEQKQPEREQKAELEEPSEEKKSEEKAEREEPAQEEKEQ